MINKLSDFEKNMLLMAGSGGVGMMYSYILYENVTNNAFAVSSILTAFFLGGFALSLSIRTIVKRRTDKKIEKNQTISSTYIKTENKKETKKGFYYGNKKK
ncbi:MAG: hypothetical protein D8H95_27155 [Lachnospiraceae bacterium]|jgi:hypothetical protein|nr:MAG: hypothetical protein D8H95_27155 [Lachnospiraceae bacterium]